MSEQTGRLSELLNFAGLIFICVVMLLLTRQLETLENRMDAFTTYHAPASKLCPCESCDCQGEQEEPEPKLELPPVFKPVKEVK